MASLDKMASMTRTNAAGQYPITDPPMPPQDFFGTIVAIDQGDNMMCYKILPDLVNGHPDKKPHNPSDRLYASVQSKQEAPQTPYFCTSFQQSSLDCLRDERGASQQ